MATLALALLAGILSTLSPCTIPLLPIVLGAALTEHRLGPFALAAGLALSFVAIGLFVATIGFAAGIDQTVFRTIAAVLLLAVGLVLMLPPLQARLAVAAGPAGNWIQNRAGGFSPRGLSGQFLVGLLLGAVWSPCVGPTLGAASILAAQGKDLAAVALTMLAFGIGAALPLIVLGLVSREALLRWRTRLMSAGQTGKLAMGAVLALAGLLILTGLDKQLEAALVAASPEWLTDLTTRF
jgi:cytochrome c biogenesis protein CcdA